MTKWYECAAEMLQNHEHKKIKDMQVNFDAKLENMKSEVDNLKQIKVQLETHQDTLISEYDTQINDLRNQLQSAESKS